MSTPPATPVRIAAQDEPARVRAGLLYGIAAYAWWGLVPAYFKLLAYVPATVVLGHRVVWSMLLLSALIGARRAWPEVRAVLRTPRVRPWLAVSTLLIATNWLVFIYAVASGRLMEASLGYFINPLVMVLVGMLFLGERLRLGQWGAVLLAAAGIAYLSLAHGGIPWIAIVLPISFGLYGLVRKRMSVGPLVGLFVETAILTPFAAAYLAWSHVGGGEGVPAINSGATIGLLSLAGVITTVPLLCFVAGAQRLRLVTMGFLQYISPSLQFITAALVFGEPFGPERAVAFGLIWAALALFIADSVGAVRRHGRARSRAAAGMP